MTLVVLAYLTVFPADLPVLLGILYDRSGSIEHAKVRWAIMDNRSYDSQQITGNDKEEMNSSAPANPFLGSRGISCSRASWPEAGEDPGLRPGLPGTG
jgi:hypothetical protein